MCKKCFELKEQYAGRIDVLLGVESDFFPEHAEVIGSQYAKYPFDYIIGSVHRLDEPQHLQQEALESPAGLLSKKSSKIAICN